MTTPTSTRSGRVSIKDVAAATARTNAAQQSKAEHAQALEGFTSENPNWTHRRPERRPMR